MLQVFPILAWVAAVASAVLLILLRATAELGVLPFYAALIWFIVALACQVGGGSAVVTVGGLVAQTVLAIVLLVRWRMVTVR